MNPPAPVPGNRLPSELLEGSEGCDVWLQGEGCVGWEGWIARSPVVERARGRLDCGMREVNVLEVALVWSIS